MRTTLALLLSAVLLSLSLGIASAHVVGGQLKIVDDYRVQFSTTPEQPEKNKPVLLLFSVQDLEMRDVKNLTVRVLVKQGDKVVYDSGESEKKTGDFQVSFKPEESGNYLVVLTFRHGDSGDLTAEFGFTVGGGGERFPFEVLVGVAVLVVIVVLVRRRVRGG